jgi:hypothetical protein
VIVPPFTIDRAVYGMMLSWSGGSDILAQSPNVSLNSAPSERVQRPSFLFDGTFFNAICIRQPASTADYAPLVGDF